MSTQQQEIKKIWRIKALDSTSVVELRAIHPSRNPISKLFKGANFDSIEALKLAFANEALRLNDVGYNVYYVMNPINDNFADRSVKDKDIAYRDLLLIDIDKVGHKGESSTDAELEAARLLSEQIADYLKSEGWDDPIRMMSGNGYHLYYILDELPNDEKTKALVEGALRELAEKFNNDIVAIDTVVFNASRITKVPGTIARKGQNTSERPHRMAEVL
ncbi:hypothetical protein G6677_00195 [Polynucleobacter paneuropaeus]|nr:hypothetical protein [Polynucleobacter paneuropaeus]